MIIYYNPQCSKCREALSLLEGESCEVEIRNYMKEPPTKKELKELLKKLGIKAFDLVRTKEQFYKDNYEEKKLTSDQWIKVLIDHPELIERPVVVDGEKALVGRPPVLVLDLVKRKKR
jgi:arsenate reductase